MKWFNQLRREKKYELIAYFLAYGSMIITAITTGNISKSVCITFLVVVITVVCFECSDGKAGRRRE